MPLWQHMMVGQGIYDLFVDETETAARSSDPAALRDSARVNPELLDALRSFDRGTDRRGRLEDAGGPRGRRGKERRGRTSGGPPPGGARFGGGPSRADVIERLDRDGLLPAITFIFSRAGCNGAVGQLLARDVRLIPQVEGDRIRRRVEERVSALADEDLGVLGYWEFVEGLSRGFAAHHAGMLPTFREIVEELFTDGRIRAVFATETLALGINMPARTVVLERLVKFNGETHADITPAEYTQLTGRAGRRGIDIEGHAVVLHQRGVDPARRRRPGVHAHLPAALQLPTDLQHGRQPRAAGRPRDAPARSSRPRSPSSRPTGPWSAWRGRCAATRRRWRATPRR